MKEKERNKYHMVHRIQSLCCHLLYHCLRYSSCCLMTFYLQKPRSKMHWDGQMDRQTHWRTDGGMDMLPIEIRSRVWKGGERTLRDSFNEDRVLARAYSKNLQMLLIPAFFPGPKFPLRFFWSWLLLFVKAFLACQHSCCLSTHVLIFLSTFSFTKTLKVGKTPVISFQERRRRLVFLPHDAVS